MHFTKWHGCGNDFVFVNGFKENAEQAALSCVTGITA